MSENLYSITYQMNDLKKIGQQLKEERIKQGMSIKQLSFLSGVNGITIHGYETE